MINSSKHIAISCSIACFFITSDSIIATFPATLMVNFTIFYPCRSRSPQVLMLTTVRLCWASQQGFWSSAFGLAAGHQDCHLKAGLGSEVSELRAMLLMLLTRNAQIFDLIMMIQFHFDRWTPHLICYCNLFILYVGELQSLNGSNAAGSIRPSCCEISLWRVSSRHGTSAQSWGTWREYEGIWLL